MRGRQRHNQILFHAGSFSATEEALWRELGAIRRAEPLAPVVVVVPTALLCRHLAAAGAERGGILNVHLLTLLDLAERTGAPVLAAQGRSPLPPLGGELIARAVCRERNTDYFASIADRAGFHRALLATVADLKEAGHRPGDLARMLTRPPWRGSPLLPKLRELHALWAAYEDRLGALALYDRDDLLAAAAEAAPTDQWLAQAVMVMVYGFYDLNELQRRLVGAATSGRPARAFFPYAPGAEAFAYARPTFDWFLGLGFEARPEPEPELPPELAALQRCLFAHPDGEAPTPEGRVRIIAAPDEVREVRAIVRDAVAGARKGQALPRIGILLRQSAVYAPLFVEECEAGGLAAYHHDPPPLSASRAGRSFLMLLRLIGSGPSTSPSSPPHPLSACGEGAGGRGLARAEVMDFVTYADIPFEAILPRGPGPSGAEGSPEPSPSDWDLLSIQAGIVKGRDTWDRRLAARRRWLEADSAEGDHHARAQLAALDSFRTFLDSFFPALSQVPTRGTWAELTSAVLGVFVAFVRESQERDDVAARVAQLRSLDLTGEGADPPTFARLARETLEGTRPRPPRPTTFGSCGPVVVDLMEGRGLPFDVVCIPGLVEKGFPALPGQDPLLSDAERAQLGRGEPCVRPRGANTRFAPTSAAGVALPLKSTRASEEQLLFRLAVGAAASGVTLTYPRMEPSSGRVRVPSHFLLRAVEAVTGKRSDYKGLSKFSGYARIRASAFAPEPPEAAWREGEYDLAVVREALASREAGGLGFLAEVSPTFAAALHAETLRWGEKVFTEYDGVLRDPDALAALERRLGAAPWPLRATAIELYASCPFRFFLEHILQVAPVEEPEAVQRLSGLDRGRLMHRILHRALAQAKTEGKLPLKPGDAEGVLAVARHGFGEFEAEGLVGYPALWEIEREAIEIELRRFVLDEASDDAGYVPAHFEVSFGFGPHEGDGELSNEQGLVFALGASPPSPSPRVGRGQGGEGGLRVIGRIDRIDLRPDGTHGRVIDYKTGSASGRPKADCFAGGTTLQLPVYLKAAETLLVPGATIDVALYRYVTARGDYAVVGFSRDAYARREPEFLTILATIADGIRKGRFFAAVAVPLAAPPCRGCDYRAACGLAAAALARKKVEDRTAQDYLSMRAIE
jgi:hypothetical protein